MNVVVVEVTGDELHDIRMVALKGNTVKTQNTLFHYAGTEYTRPTQQPEGHLPLVASQSLY